MSRKECVLVTGSAGFIGFHLSIKLCEIGYSVVGIDNMNDYYEVSLKHARLEILKKIPEYRFQLIDLTNREEVESLFNSNKFDFVVNLAAQAGVRYSITNPYVYLESNLYGFLNILESSQRSKIKHLLFASSSSVYGANKKMPFSVHDNVDHPISLYAATKKANELMAHTYASLHKLPSTGLRFFTVYGPYGRPDMALFLFTRAIIRGEPIDVYNFGRMRRDFTYVDDIVEGIIRLVPNPPLGNGNWDELKPDPASSFAPYRLFNIGNNNPVELLRFIEILEEKIGRKAVKNFLPLQIGDVPETYADIDDLKALVGFEPKTSIEGGIGKFVDWYLDYYNIKL